MFTVGAAAVAGANQGTPPVKPKRKKPGTAIKRKVQPITVDAKGNKEGMGGSMVKWFRALDLKAGGPWLKYSALPLYGFVLGSPEFNSLTALCKWPTGQPPTCWDSKLIMFYLQYLFVYLQCPQLAQQC